MKECCYTANYNALIVKDDIYPKNCNIKNGPRFLFCKIFGPKKNYTLELVSEWLSEGQTDS